MEHGFFLQLLIFFFDLVYLLECTNHFSSIFLSLFFITTRNSFQLLPPHFPPPCFPPYRKQKTTRKRKKRKKRKIKRVSSAHHLVPGRRENSQSRRDSASSSWDRLDISPLRQPKQKNWESFLEASEERILFIILLFYNNKIYNNCNCESWEKETNSSRAY